MNRYFSLLAFFYLTGLIASLYLVSLSITQSSPFCQLFGSDCAAVVLSEFGTLLGFSTASFGLGYFIFQLVFLGFLVYASGNPAQIPFSPTPALFLNLAACTASLIYIVLLFFILKQSCIACMTVHLVNFITLPLNYCTWNSLKNKKIQLAPSIIAILLAVNSLLIVKIIDTGHALNIADDQTQEYLELALYKHDEAQKFYFKKETGDAIYGEPDIALYQVVLIYKDNCPHCKRAKEKLIDLVAEHYQSIYLLMINYANLGAKQLTEMNVERVPAVFINGKRAVGWEIKGFLDTFIEDCDC